MMQFREGGNTVTLPGHVQTCSEFPMSVQWDLYNKGTLCSGGITDRGSYMVGSIQRGTLYGRVCTEGWEVIVC